MDLVPALGPVGLLLDGRAAAAGTIAEGTDEPLGLIGGWAAWTDAACPDAACSACLAAECIPGGSR